MSSFDSLTLALEGWFDKPLCDLPDALRQRVEQEFFLISWDKMSAEGRRSIALESDYKNDPVMQQSRQFSWDLASCVIDLKTRIAKWKSVSAPIASELAQKETRLAELQQQLARLETQMRQARVDYITGKELIERWRGKLHAHPSEFIEARIAESLLLDIQPFRGGAQAAFSENFVGLPLESWFFLLSDIERIEAVYFAKAVKAEDRTSDANQFPSAGPCSAFSAMENLVSAEFTIAFVGDQSESGLSANNMLEITARKVTRRVALAALDLVDRRKGTLNNQGVILLGIAKGEKLSSPQRNSTKVKRLRDVFRLHFYVKDDPFEPYRQGVGWVPQFKIIDKRGAADERAKREAERKTDSYERLTQFFESYPARAQSWEDSDTDVASDWLKENDPNAKP